MLIRDIINKCLIGYSPLSGRLFVYYPDKDGSAKYKKQITGNRKETVQLLADWLKTLSEEE